MLYRSFTAVNVGVSPSTPARTSQTQSNPTTRRSSILQTIFASDPRECRQAEPRHPILGAALRDRSLFLTACVLAALSTFARAQAVSTASERLQLSAFAGGSGVYTGIRNGRNLAITVGADLGLRRYFHVNPALEVRGTYPVDNGAVAGERNVLGGLRFMGSIGRLHPYGDILFGRGELQYNPPLLNPQQTFRYTQTTSNVLSPGAGVEFDLSPQFALRGDVQFQRYSTPVTVSGHAFAEPVTAALTYRFNFNRHSIGRHR